MTRQKLLRLIRQVHADQLVDETWQDRMAAAVARSEKIEAIAWRKGPGSGRVPLRLYTPYGNLARMVCEP